MNDFLQIAQSLAVALKALQMYTEAHPRAQESLAQAHAILCRWLGEQEQLQFVATGSKAFVDGQSQDTRPPQVAALVKLVTERSISGITFERGVTTNDYLTFLQGLAMKPQKLEEQGGFEAFLQSAGVLRIKVSRTRYQEIMDGEKAGAGEEKAPLFNPAPSKESPALSVKTPVSPDTLLKYLQNALVAAMAGGGSHPDPSHSREDGSLGFLKRVHPADLSGLGPLGQNLGLGEGMPNAAQLGTLREVLLGLTPEAQMNLLSGLSSLPEHPRGLALGVSALAGEILASAIAASLAQGASWPQLRGPIKEILRPQSNRESLVRALSARMHSSGQDASQGEFILRQLEWEDLNHLVIMDGEKAGTGEKKAPHLHPAPPVKPPESPAKTPVSSGALQKFLQNVLVASMAGGGNHADFSHSAEDGPLEFLKRVTPADLSGLGPLGQNLGLGEGMPTPAQFGTLRQVLLGLTPEAQMNLLLGLSSLPEHPRGLVLGLSALAGEILASATAASLAKGASWPQLRGPIKDILRPLPNRESLVRALSARLHGSGQDASQGEFILRQLEWEDLSLEAKLVKILEGGSLFELSLEQRLALLRELLDLRRFKNFLRVQEVVVQLLSSDRADFRLNAVQTLAGMAHWAQDPGLPSEAEDPMAEALRAHFAWEPDPSIHRWTTEALESLLTALVFRGEFVHVISDFRELEDLTTFLEKQYPWRSEAIHRLRSALTRPLLMDAVVDHSFTMARDRVIQEVHPYLVFLGDPMARCLVVRLGEESDRIRRGRLVEEVRSMGSTSLAALLDALTSPAWFLVRNALTLLSDLGDVDCLPAIIPLLRHPEPRVRRTAVRALWKLGGPAAERHLLARMKDTDAETMQEIFFVLGQLRSENSLPAVRELAEDKRVLERLRIQALNTLGQIASPKAMPVILGCMRRKGFFSVGEPSAIRMAAAKALAALGTPEARAALQKAANTEPKGEERELLHRLLGRPAAP